MKKVLLVCTLFCSFFGSAQKTVQFADPLPPNYKLVQQVDKANFGTYESPVSGTVYLFDESGISIVSVVTAYITREQLRESSTIQHRNGYLFGIVKGDSIPCVLEGERFYYGIRTKQVLVGESGPHRLTRLDARTYIVNFLEGTFFEPSLFTFENNSLKIVHGNTDMLPEHSKILVVNTITRYSSPVDILAPAESQWPELKKLLFTGDVLNYIKQS